MDFLGAEQLEQALECFETVLGGDPDHALANYQVGMIGFRLFNQDLANRFLGKAAEKLAAQARNGGLEHQAWLTLIHCLVALGRPKDADDTARAAVAAFPNDPDVYLAVAKFVVQMGLHDVAVTLLERCIAAGKDDAVVYSELGTALAATARESEAFAAVERAIELAPEESDYYLQLGQMYQGSNLTAGRAVEAYRRGLAAAPSNELYVNVGNTLRICGQFDEAAETLREGLAFCSPNSPAASVEIKYLLGQVLRLAGRHGEAVKEWDAALETCRILSQWSDQAVRFVGQELRLYWALGRRDEGLALFEALRGGRSPEKYFYDPCNYLADTPRRLRQLKEVIRGRDVFILMHGPSVEDLGARIADLAGRDVCFMTAQGFTLFESSMLAKIGREVEIATVTNPMTMSKHYDQVQEFLARPTRNMLLTSRYCLNQCEQEEENGRRTEGAFDRKLLYFPPPATVLPPSRTSPLSFPLCNTLSCMLPFLVLGEAKRVFLFGCDGTSRESVDGHYRYGTGHADYRYEPKNEEEKRMLAQNLLVDTLSFDEAADISLEGASALFDLPVPPIYNVSPQSHLNLFPKIRIEACFEMISGSS